MDGTQNEQKTTIATALPMSLPQENVDTKQRILKIVFGVLLFIFILMIFSFLFFILPNEKKKSIATVPLTPKQLSGSEGKVETLQDPTLSGQGKESANLILQKIKSAFVFSPETKVISTTLFKMGNGEVWDNQLAEEYLRSNEEALKLLSEFSNKETYKDPMYQKINKDTVASSTSELTFMKNLLTVSNIDFENALRKGDTKKAETILFERLKITNLLLGSHAEELSSLRASALRSQVLTNLLPRLLAKEKLNAQSSLIFEEKIRSLPAPTDSYYDFLNTEAALFAAQNTLSIDELAVNQKDKRVVQVLQMAADTSLADFKSISKVYADETKKSCTQINEGNVRSQMIIITTKTGPNKEAESFFDDKVKELFEAYLPSLTRKCADDIATKSALALIGIKAYSDEKGDIPETLNSLFPLYLSTIPIDPYDEKSFKYNKEKGYVYSIGEDKINSGGGMENVYWSKMNDPTFRIIE